MLTIQKAYASACAVCGCMAVGLKGAKRCWLALFLGVAAVQQNQMSCGCACVCLLACTWPKWACKRYQNNNKKCTA